MFLLSNSCRFICLAMLGTLLVVPGCGYKNSGFLSPEEFLDNPYVSQAIEESGLDVHLGNNPPDIEGEYDESSSTVVDASDRLSNLIGGKLGALMLLSNQKPDGIISVSESSDGSVFAQGRGVFISGVGSDFTLWIEGQNVFGESSVVIIAGTKKADGNLEIQGLSVYTANPRAPAEVGDWWAYKPEFTLVSNSSWWQPDEYTINSLEGMSEIAAGSFFMGCNSQRDMDCGADQLPYHEVVLTAYWLDRSEVTVQAYSECVDDGACSEPGKEAGCNWGASGREFHPVNCVSWHQAREYCEWLGKRLPTEAEWEKGARGTDGRKYPWGNEDATCSLAIMDDDFHDAGCDSLTTAPVCSRSPEGDGPWDLCDVGGNVWEWVSDWYSPTYYSEDVTVNPIGPDMGSDRSMRGGSYVNRPAYLRTSMRNSADPDGRFHTIGFRCAADI